MVHTEYRKLGTKIFLAGIIFSFTCINLHTTSASSDIRISHSYFSSCNIPSILHVDNLVYISSPYMVNPRNIFDNYMIKYLVVFLSLLFIILLLGRRLKLRSKLDMGIRDFMYKVKKHRRGQQKYHALINSFKTRYIFMCIAKNGNISYISPSVRHILGMTPKESEVHYKIFIPDIPRNNLIKEEIGQVLRGLKSKNIEWEAKAKDGSEVLFNAKLTPVFNKNNDIIGAECVLHDITKIKYHEQDLLHYAEEVEDVIRDRANEFRTLSSAVNQTSSPILITDFDGKIEFVNEAFCQTTGYNKQEIIGNYPSILNSGYYDEAYYKKMWKTIKSGKTWIAEFCNKKKDGSLYWELAQITPVIDPNGEITHFVGVKEDITKRKKEQSELIRAKEMAESANVAKSNFLANMSHEIRTPMNAIIGFSEILDRKIEDSELRDYLDSIKTSSKALLGLINDILDLSKIEAGKMKIKKDMVNIYQFANDLELLFMNRAKNKGLDFEVNTINKLPKNIEFDELHVRQIAINLIGNAIKFTNKGFVKVLMLCDNVGPEHLDFVMQISDTGIGIPENKKKEIFGDFTQSDESITRSFGGTGLGLSISKKIAELCKGFILVESAIGKGSTFTVTLPRLKYSNQQASTNGATKIDPDTVMFDHANLLVVDDILSNRQLLQTHLSSLGFSVYLAENGVQAIELTKKIKPNLILMDMRMPEMDGFKATKILSSDDQTKHIPIISCTATTFKLNEEDALKYGFSGFIRKPFLYEEIILELCKHLNWKTKVNKKKKQIETTLTKGDIDFLKTHLKTQWDKNKNNKSAKAKKEIALQLISIGEKCQNTQLTKMGQDIKNAINSFNIDKVNTLWHELEKQIEN